MVLGASKSTLEGSRDTARPFPNDVEFFDIPTPEGAAGIKALKAIDTALARTPAKSLAKFQADTLEEIANLIRQTTPDARSTSNYDRGVFEGRYRAIDQIESEVKSLRGGGGMQAFVEETVANEEVPVAAGENAPGLDAALRKAWEAQHGN